MHRSFTHITREMVEEDSRSHGLCREVECLPGEEVTFKTGS